MFKNEAKIRDWVRDLDVAKEWTESTKNNFGATQGQADVKLMWGDMVIPVELKCWRMLKMGDFAARMRREQVRYHCVMAKARVKTLVLWGSPDVDGIFCLPGYNAPEKTVSRVSLDNCFSFDASAKSDFLRNLFGLKFW